MSWQMVKVQAWVDDYAQDPGWGVGGPGGGQPPNVIWPSPGVPTHPIAPGGPPPGIWPSPGYPAHPIAPGGPGGPPNVIWPSPGYPSHPIAPGGPPPGIWGGAGEGFPTPPIYLPVDPPPDSGLSPEHPIYIPVPMPPVDQGPVDPGYGVPGPPYQRLSEAIKQAIVDFWTGNLPENPTETPQPV